jgi:hypothetical protein
MITLLLLTVFCLAVFFVALFSPHKGTLIQSTTTKLRKKIASYANQKSRPVKWLIGPPSHISHKTIHKSAHAGKKTKKRVNKLKQMP